MKKTQKKRAVEMARKGDRVGYIAARMGVRSVEIIRLLKGMGMDVKGGGREDWWGKDGYWQKRKFGG